MKHDVRYLGSVRFYKHLILFIMASVILLPIAGLFFVLAQYRGLKRESDIKENEQQLYISQLEEKLAFYEEQWKNKDTDFPSETKGSETEESDQVHETPGEQEITDDDVSLIPFDVDLEEIKYILINDANPLSESYQLDLAETKNGKLVHKEIKVSLEQMIDDAREEGLELIICSAYRDYEKQASLVEESIIGYMKEGYDYKEAHFRARCYLAMVGRSEHHSGLAVDLVGVAYQVLDEGQADTPENKWLYEHAHKYGFILRYPENKEEITGILYEPWHFRYVGESAASYMKENQLCLEEFLDLVCIQNEKNEQ